LTWFGYPRPTI